MGTLLNCVRHTRRAPAETIRKESDGASLQRRSNGAASRMHSRERDDICKDVQARIVIVFLRSDDARIGIARVLQRLEFTGGGWMLGARRLARRGELRSLDRRGGDFAARAFFSAHEVGAMYWVISV